MREWPLFGDASPPDLWAPRCGQRHPGESKTMYDARTCSKLRKSRRFHNWRLALLIFPGVITIIDP